MTNSINNRFSHSLHTSNRSTVISYFSTTSLPIGKSGKQCIISSNYEPQKVNAFQQRRLLLKSSWPKISINLHKRKSRMWTEINLAFFFNTVTQYDKLFCIF